MTDPNPAQELLDRLRSQFGEPLSDAAETIVERFLAPFALVPKHEFANHLEALEQLERDVERLTARVTELETQASAAASAPAKKARKTKKNTATDKPDKKKSAKKKAGKKKHSDSN